MDTLTPLLILAAKNAAAEEKQGKSYIGAATVYAGMASVLGPGAVVGSAILGNVLCGLLWKKDKKKKEGEKQAGTPAVDERVIEAVVERIKADLPSLLETIDGTPSGEIVSEAYNTVYTTQIAKAQEFLNENSNADLSRVKCLLRVMLPEQYHRIIDRLKQHQDPQVIINIMGGQNIVAPNAGDVCQHINDTERS